jgi:hypothetical protein
MEDTSIYGVHRLINKQNCRSEPVSEPHRFPKHGTLHLRGFKLKTIPVRYLIVTQKGFDIDIKTSALEPFKVK